MTSFHTIVAAVDFSETSQDALAAACDIAREARGTLHLLHVVPMPGYEAWSVTAPNIEAAGLQAQWLDDAHARLEALAERLPLERTRVSCAAIAGQPAQTIVGYAAEHAAGLIVMGTHGYGAVNRLLLGSVADRVLRQTSCPVLVVPHRAAATAAAA